MDSGRNFFLYGYSFALFTTKTVQSITLPSDANVEVLAIDVVGSSSAPPAPSGRSNPIDRLANLAASVPGSLVIGSGYAYAVGAGASGNIAQQVQAKAATTVTVAYRNRADRTTDNLQALLALKKRLHGAKGRGINLDLEE
jgi:hypothetical protein